MCTEENKELFAMSIRCRARRISLICTEDYLDQLLAEIFELSEKLYCLAEIAE